MQQLRLPLTEPVLRPGHPPMVVVDGHALPVVVTRHRRARRYLVGVTGDGRVRLTVPSRGAIRDGLRLVETEVEWIAREWRRLRDAANWGAGTPVWFRGVREPLRCDRDGIRLGDLRVAAGRPGDGPPQADRVRALVQAAMRAVAVRELVAQARRTAEASGFAPTRVIVRNQRTRWGSCSGRGVVSLNWRLIQMPPAVADYVIRHELVHLRHPDHSRRFWRAVEAVCPGWREAEAWLRRFGRDLL